MAAATNSKILLNRNTKKKQQRRVVGRYCSICGKKLKFFSRTNEYLLTCWNCMIVNEDS